MKKTKIIYWILTGLFALFMIMTAIPDIILEPDAVALIHTRLGYPTYFITFIGWAKIVGAVAIIIPGFPRIKEWAYAGLLFDLITATYSMWAIGEPFANWNLMLVFVALGFASYIYYRKKTAVLVSAS